MSRIITNASAFNTGLFFSSYVNITISADTNDLVVPGMSNFVLIRTNVTGNHSLTGITPPTLTDGWWAIVYNIGIGNLSLKDNDAASSATGRLLMGSNKSVQTNESVSFIYDVVSLRWRIMGINI